MKKLVYESLNEMNFERRKDPLSALDIGVKTMIRKWMNIFGYKEEKGNYKINDDMSIDLNCILNLSYEHLKEFPYYIQFNKAQRFDCSHNELTSLRGCPKIVVQDFICSHNEFVSLEGCPKFVGGDFMCNYNKTKQFTANDIRDVCKVGGIISSSKNF
jgi:hypothetical protein